MEFIEKLTSWILKLGLPQNIANPVTFIYKLLLLAVAAYVIDIITKKILLNIIQKFIQKSKTNWDDIIYKRKVFHKLAHIVPAVVIQYFITHFFYEFPGVISFLHNIMTIFIIFISINAIAAFLNGLHDIYLTLPISENKPIKSFVQITILIIYFIGIILILSTMLDKEVRYFFTGLGAIAAVLMLVFKDTILGLVGGIQLSANDMVRPGDWIEMPSRKADGDVIDISLHTVKVQNWDKTITTIPTYALVNESFVNWRGMSESGGRRIKRSINIDMTSVKYCSKEMIEQLKQIKLLKPYIESKLVELDEYNNKLGIDEKVLVNGRRMTNLGTFRKYIEAYLHHHPKINQDMTFLIRQLQPSDKGIPLEIYVFCNDKVWANYEAIQADIFDHMLAAIPQFELAVYQGPTGNDLKKLILNNG